MKARTSFPNAGSSGELQEAPGSSRHGGEAGYTPRCQQTHRASYTPYRLSDCRIPSFLNQPWHHCSTRRRRPVCSSHKLSASQPAATCSVCPHHSLRPRALTASTHAQLTMRTQAKMADCLSTPCQQSCKPPRPSPQSNGTRSSSTAVPLACLSRSSAASRPPT